MTNHLSQEQFARCIVGRARGAELQHIAHCRECSAQLESFANGVSVFRSALKNRINDRIALAAPGLTLVRPAETTNPAWRWALVAAAVMVVVMLPFFSIENAPPENFELPSVEMSAEEVMSRVRLHLSGTLPAPMEPIMSLIPGEQLIPRSGGVQ